MSPSARRLLITIVVVVVALLVVTAVATRRPPATQQQAAVQGTQTQGAAGAVGESGSQPAGAPAGSQDAAASSGARGADAQGAADAASGSQAAEDRMVTAPVPEPAGDAPQRPGLGADLTNRRGGPIDTSRWRAAAPEGAPPAGAGSLGSLDPRVARLRLDLARRGAGIERIAFSDIWETSGARRAAAAHWRAVAAGDASPPSMPPEDLRYILQTAQPLGSIEVPLLSVHSLEVDGVLVPLHGAVWSSPRPGVFASEIRDEDGTARLRVRRTIELAEAAFGITLRQEVENLSDADLEVRWIQYGPIDLRPDRSRYIDIRRFHFGYLLPPSRDPGQLNVLVDGQMRERSQVIKAVRNGETALWPTAETRRQQLVLSWFGTTNRYFGFALHDPADVVLRTRSIEESVESIHAIVGMQPDGTEIVFTEAYSPKRGLAAGAKAAFDLAVFAGPLDRSILDDVEPYRALGMSGLIVYLMSDCCSFCTFPWLARLLLSFLAFLHDRVVFDWGLAIIVLVVIVRTFLHPIMKRSQVQMQRVTRAMAELKPELESLQTRYKSDPRKLQQEQMRLYREKGVNPVGCVTGMVPTLLQMPIWIALYAMLYYAYELRQQPAFFGFFQLFWNWPFLADLSSSDHFFLEFAEPRQFLFLNLTGINLLPVLMGVVFWFQQKYMTPPPTVKLTPEQQQQQAIMKWMMVVLFPVMLYAAPSGLTLYILTSSLIGIVEGKQIRRHIAKMDAQGPQEQGKKKKKQDMLGRLYEKALERAQEREQARRNPPKRYKDRS
ncbi:MAG TPA: membrane protein insertase YidC [Phycisphaerales bacterium]|nr:membrane protein insertase YidC [Phycisphaerales bacterium]HMP38260.1 membrane protein insertase YidC [Phycisphaerales bacterium]